MGMLRAPPPGLPWAASPGGHLKLLRRTNFSTAKPMVPVFPSWGRQGWWGQQTVQQLPWSPCRRQLSCDCEALLCLQGPGTLLPRELGPPRPFGTPLGISPLPPALISASFSPVFAPAVSPASSGLAVASHHRRGRRLTLHVGCSSRAAVRAAGVTGHVHLPGGPGQVPSTLLMKLFTRAWVE